jgi:MoaE-MoaD fusion protein
MRVRVLFFGQFREIADTSEQEFELPAGSSVRDAFSTCASRFPDLNKFRGIAIAARNQEYAAWDAPVQDSDEIAFLPPVSGGSGNTKFAVSGETCELVSESIPVADWVAAVKAPEDGAVVAFEVIVRNHSRGKQTTHLIYEAYQPMALAKMREIATQARDKFAIHRIVMVHRLGRMEIGETSVLIAVSAPHRAAAFDACRFAIDTLKRTVPIWKKEYFADGSAWADGEMPSSELR